MNQVLDKNQRRKRIVLRNTLFAFLGYLFPFSATVIARLVGLIPTSYERMAILFAMIAGSTIIFAAVIQAKRAVSPFFGNAIGVAQLVNWLIIYAYWTVLLDEVRVVALICALIALIYLISYATFLQSALISIFTVLAYLAVSYHAITHLGQPGSVVRELFHVCCFIPVAFFVASMAALFSRQRREVENAKRAAEQARDQLWGEMELAQKIQTVLLPSKPAIPGFEIVAYMAPASEVGGDYYDIINVGGLDWIVIGDVSGHGVPAGLVMMMVQSSIRTALMQCPDCSPAELLAVVNNALVENIRKIDEDKYMTITVFAAHREGRFNFSGLHQDILIHRRASGRVEIVETDGLWLGITEDLRRLNRDETIMIDPGDTMLLYTDGITEAIDKDGDMFSSAKLAEVFSRLGNGPLLEIRNGILAALRPYRCHDDVTILLVRRT